VRGVEGLLLHVFFAMEIAAREVWAITADCSIVCLDSLMSTLEQSFNVELLLEMAELMLPILPSLVMG